MFLEWTWGTVHSVYVLVLVLVVCVFEDPALTLLLHLQVKVGVRNLSQCETGSECDLKGRDLKKKRHERT